MPTIALGTQLKNRRRQGSGAPFPTPQPPQRTNAQWAAAPGGNRVNAEWAAAPGGNRVNAEWAVEGA